MRRDAGTWASLTGGELRQPGDGRAIEDASIDTRTVSAGLIFFAIRGPRFDGHDFIGEALRRGASALVVHRPLSIEIPNEIALIQVSDTLIGLQNAAAAWRRQMSAHIVGVTGSNGKTTTKEMLASILSLEGPTLATAGNFNNHIGLPLTLLRLKPDHRFAVIEMGTSMPGDMDPLCRMTKPDTALITNVGEDHLEFFGSPAGVLRENWKLFEALPATGTAIINEDDPLIRQRSTTLECRQLHYSSHSYCSVHSESVQLRDRGVGFTLVIEGVSYNATLPIPGAVQILNALAAAAAATALGVPAARIIEGLARFKPVAMRMEIYDHHEGGTLINDAYNANPSSMEASISSFCESFQKQPRWVVLGDMRELGPTARESHRKLGHWLAQQPLAGVFLYGRDARFIEAGLRASHASFPVERYRKKRYLLDALRQRLTSGHPAVLFKASRRMRLETLVKDLLQPCCSS